MLRRKKVRIPVYNRNKVKAKLLMKMLIAFILIPPEMTANKQKGENNMCFVNMRTVCHCYKIKNSPEIRFNVTCWITSKMQENDPLYTVFARQDNIESLVFGDKVGELNFIPKTILDYSSKIKRLGFVSGQISKINKYAFCNVSHTEEIFVVNNCLRTISEHAFYNMTNLITVSFEKNKIENLNTEIFYEVNNLQKLKLNDNRISVISNGTFLQTRRLKILNLNNNIIRDLNEESFKGLEQLVHLDLRKNKLQFIGSFTFKDLWKCRTILLDYNRIKALGNRAFDGLPEIRHISLKGNKLVTLPEGLLRGARTLVGLDLQYNKINKISFDDLEPILHRLEEPNSFICLTGNNIRCDCNINWIYKLNNNTKSIQVKEELEKLLCAMKPVDYVKIPYIHYTQEEPNIKVIPEKDVHNDDDINDYGGCYTSDNVDEMYMYTGKYTSTGYEVAPIEHNISFFCPPNNIKNKTAPITVPATEYKNDNLLKSASSEISFNKSMILILAIVMLKY